jgi:xanthine dehydrogenase accessory factor
MDSQKQLLSHILQETASGRKVAWCVVVETEGSTPQVPGSMMIVTEDSRIHGTVGGGCAEASARKRAFELLASGVSDMLEIDLDNETVSEEGMICGGCMKIAILVFPDNVLQTAITEALGQLEQGLAARIPLLIEQEGRLTRYLLTLEMNPVLVIAGAGHISQEMAKLAHLLDFRVIVIDNRADFANEHRFPAPATVMVGDIAQVLTELPMDMSTYVVIVTRGHQHDQDALNAVITRPAKYIGMIGSKRKVKMIMENLAAAGIPATLIEKVHSPIGLPIKSITVPEIAVSIAAQLIQIRRANYQDIIEGPEFL